MTTSDPRKPSDATQMGGPTTSTPVATACESAAIWGARDDFALEPAGTGGEFAEAVNALVRLSGVSPIAVSVHMDPGCVWMMALSSPEKSDVVGAEHAATFTPMLRHPAGLWTAAPQSKGWLRVVDRAARSVWIPIVEITGSGTYGEASCASLSAVRVAAVVPASASDLRLATAKGDRTVRDLMGAEPNALGWNVRFTFSADTAH